MIELPSVVRMGRQIRNLDVVRLHARLADMSDGKDLPTVRVLDHIRFLLETGDVDTARRTLQGRRAGETAAAILLSVNSVRKALDRVRPELRRTLDDEKSRARRSIRGGPTGRTPNALPKSTAVTDEPSGGAKRSAVHHLGLALFVIAAAQLMVILDATLVNVALPTIQKALGFSGTGLEWVVNAYALTLGGLLLFGQRSSDIWAAAGSSSLGRSCSRWPPCSVGSPPARRGSWQHVLSREWAELSSPPLQCRRSPPLFRRVDSATGRWLSGR